MNLSKITKDVVVDTERDHLEGTFDALFIHSSCLIPLEYEYDDLPFINQDGDTYYGHNMLVGKYGCSTNVYMTVAVSQEDKSRTVNFTIKVKGNNGSLRDYQIEDNIGELINVLENNTNINWEKYEM